MSDSSGTEVYFYHLERQTLEDILPGLLERSLERGWRVGVQAASEERVEALDTLLWTYREDSFLPHGTWRDSEASQQPILLTVRDDNPNAAKVRFLLDGAPVPQDAGAYERIVLVFDGDDAMKGLRCVACQICEKECPPQCIYIVKSKDKKDKKRKQKKQSL